jgi:hypothetical protein
MSLKMIQNLIWAPVYNIVALPAAQVLFAWHACSLIIGATLICPKARFVMAVMQD